MKNFLRTNTSKSAGKAERNFQQNFNSVEVKINKEIKVLFIKRDETRQIGIVLVNLKLLK